LGIDDSLKSSFLLNIFVFPKNVIVETGDDFIPIDAQQIRFLAQQRNFTKSKVYISSCETVEGSCDLSNEIHEEHPLRFENLPQKITKKAPSWESCNFSGGTNDFHGREL